jgi:hypothetical protein
MMGTVSEDLTTGKNWRGYMFLVELLFVASTLWHVGAVRRAKSTRDATRRYYRMEEEGPPSPPKE